MRKVKKMEGEELKCGICDKEITEDDDGNVVGMLCTDPPTHFFHRKCIDEWRRVPLPIASACPVCRVEPAQRVWSRTVAKRVTATVETSWWYHFKHQMRQRIDAASKTAEPWTRNAVAIVGFAVTWWLVYQSSSSVAPSDSVYIRWV